MYDEKYFFYGGDYYPEKDRYYTDDKDKCPENVRPKGEARFPEKKSSLDCDFWTWYFVKAPFPEVKDRGNKWTNLFGGVFEKKTLAIY